MGFNRGHGRVFSAVPESRTADVINMDKRSNVGKPGLWIFEISQQGGQMIPIIQSKKCCIKISMKYLIGCTTNYVCS